MSFQNLSQIISRVLLLTTAISLIACNDKVIAPPSRPVKHHTTTQSCDSFSVSFSKDILPLIEKHCWECHGAESPTHGIALDSYENIIIFGQEGTLYSSIVHDGNAAPMPWQKPKLDTCSITMVKKWIKQGMKNN